MSHNDSPGFHTESKASQSLDEFCGEQAYGLSLLGIPDCGGVVSIPIVKLSGGKPTFSRANSESIEYVNLKAFSRLLCSMFLRGWVVMEYLGP